MVLGQAVAEAQVVVSAAGTTGTELQTHSASLQLGVTPGATDFAVSVDLFLTVMLGGAGTIYGPLFGVLVLEVIREVLHEFVALRLLLFGLLLIALILFLPEGVLMPLVRQLRRLRARPAPAPAP